MNRANAPETDESFLTIAGPTAVGKTELSLSLAEQWNAEIISADSRQIYEELTTGTAKPPSEARQRVPHHFINERSIFDDPYSAGAFADDANARIREIRSRGKVPIIVGGSTLYIHALQYGLADVPDVANEVRDRIEQRLDEEGAEALYRELENVDPTQAAKMDPTKTQRLVRALEVYHGTGRPLTYYHENQPEPPFDYYTVVLNRDRQKLYRRIEKRVDRMLIEKGVDPTRQPLRTIGYREPIQYLQGDIEYDEMVRLVKRNSRRYAKRQLTWFRRYDEYDWIEIDELTVDQLVDQITESAEISVKS
jgi:tRNA dimethylallyltransferase